MMGLKGIIASAFADLVIFTEDEGLAVQRGVVRRHRFIAHFLFKKD